MVSVKIETITPAQAKEMLKGNFSRNRNLRPKRVQQYANDMKNGDWGLSTDAIGLDENGELINGQHRLNAVILANKAVAFLVVRGLPKESVMFIDGQLTRSPSDQLRISKTDTLYGNKSACALVKALLSQKCGASRSEGMSSFELEKNIDKFYFLCKYQSTKRGKGTVNNANMYVSAFSALGAGVVTFEEMEDFLKCVNYGTVDTKKKYNFQAAFQFRRWYDAPEHANRNRLKEAREIVERTDEAIYCFAKNVKSTRKKEIYSAGEAELLRANEIVKQKAYLDNSEGRHKNAAIKYEGQAVRAAI